MSFVFLLEILVLVLSVSNPVILWHRFTERAPPQSPRAADGSRLIAVESVGHHSVCLLRNKHSGHFLHVGDRDDQASVNLWQSDMASTEWKLVQQPGAGAAVYCIQDTLSGMYLTVADSNTRNGSLCTVDSDAKAWAAHWFVSPILGDPSHYSVKNRLSEKYLSGQHAGKATGDNLAIWKTAAGSESRWHLMARSAEAAAPGAFLQ